MGRGRRGVASSVPTRYIPSLRRVVVIACAVLVAMVPAAQAQDMAERLDPRFEADRLEALQERRDYLIDFYAENVPPDDYARGGHTQIAANLVRGTNLGWAAARLDSLMAAPRGDMFWMVPFTAVMMSERGQLPEATQRRIRETWRTYRPYRGDTENHWAMYYASLYLAAQKYPDEPGETWYTGKSSAENMAEAEEYLISWMDLTTTMGQGEYDSAHYVMVYLAPMALLYGFAEDPAMRQRAAMMLDYIVADFAAEDLEGFYTGAHSRVYEREAMASWQVPGSRMAWLLFGQGEFVGGWEHFVIAISGYTPPRILHHIATDRSVPYVHREGKRTRHRFRYSDVKNAPVYKYTYMRPEYSLGSSQGGLLQPIQQLTWDLTWATDKPYKEARNTFWVMHPYSSHEELGMYFAEYGEFITEIVVRSKREYDSPDKITGGSPYEQVMQHEDALVALYDIEPGTRYERMNAFFSSDLEDVTEDASGWIFARGGEVLIAMYPLAPYRWEDKRDMRDTSLVHQLFVSEHGKNGAVVQTAPASQYASFAAFQAAVRALPLEASREPTPSVRFTTLSGARISATYGETPSVNGTPVDYANWPLFDGPFLQAAQGSKTLTMRYGPIRRHLDFRTLTVTETVEPSPAPRP